MTVDSFSLQELFLKDVCIPYALLIVLITNCSQGTHIVSAVSQHPLCGLLCSSASSCYSGYVGYHKAIGRPILGGWYFHSLPKENRPGLLHLI